MLRGANLSSANFSGSDLSGVRLLDANLSDVNLGFADLTNAYLTGSNLTDARLTSTSLASANFSKTNLTNADLKMAKFTNDSFLVKADLTNADLRYARLNEVRLFEADLTGVAISYRGINDFRFDEGTTFGGRSQWEVEADSEAVQSIPYLSSSVRPLRSLGRLYTNPSNLEQAELQYRATQRLLRENDFRQLLDLTIREKHARRKRALAENDYWTWFKLAVYRWLLGYGEKPTHVVGTSLFVIVLSALLYPLWGFVISKKIASEGVELPSKFVSYSHLPDTESLLSTLVSSGSLPDTLVYGLGKSLYFSVITFTTLGYGDIQPIGFGETIAIIESFLGALLMAFLVFVLGRRTTW